MDANSDPSATGTGGAVATQLRVVVADDDTLLREGLASLLVGSGFEIVGLVGDAIDLLALVRDTSPDLVIVDIRMPPTHTTEGLDAARQIRAEWPDTGILVLSAHVELEHATELLASGQKVGYLLKSRVTDVADFIDSLERIAQRRLGRRPRTRQRVGVCSTPTRSAGPTECTRKRGACVEAEGRSNAGIGRRLWVAEGTVEKHVRNILMKLNLPETVVSSRSTALHWA